ncbi:hypothetical protein MPER_02667 [Moniliophthora perniciosa FA553]|nr:hypothetical protein MPER_02667 [Moniliophthora perniciosa FA553]
MASIGASSSTASSSTSTTPEESRPQAGPLPLKRGEMGYREELHAPEAEEPSPGPELPARHPADRENTSSETGNDATPSTTVPTSTSPTPASTSTHSIKKFLKPKKISYGGILLSTLLAFVIQIIMIAGTIAAWVVSTLVLNKKKQESQQESGGGDPITKRQLFSFSALFFTIRCWAAWP